MTSNIRRQPASQSVGEYVTVRHDDDRRGRVFVLVAQDAGSVVLRTSGGDNPAIRVGHVVECRSVIGNWEATILQAGEGCVRLRLPDWVARLSQRRHRRVPARLSVDILTGGEPRAARLQDISLSGASILVEAATSLVSGAVVTVRVPPGEISARVVSLRRHDNPHLCLLGLTWLRFDLDTGSWMRRPGRRRRRRPPLGGKCPCDALNRRPWNELVAGSQSRDP